jgi:CRISPR-associated Csx2 family protein
MNQGVNMRDVYMSFLGRGFRNEEKGCYDYKPTTYVLNGRPASETRFVQVAEMELLADKSFDLVLILCTNQSKNDHFQRMQEEMGALNIVPESLIIADDLGPQGQWDMFEKLLACIEHEDRLTVDLTHGFRSTAIVFSAAINFLQRARKIHLEAVYYGAFEMDNAQPPIIDMKDFYVVNEWAEAVSRLVDDADARKMAEVADQSSGFQAGELNDKELITALEELTNAVRNVEVNTVAERANRALALIRHKRGSVLTTGRVLLDLLEKKFRSLATNGPISGYYDKDFYHIYLAIAGLLLEHRLYMQAFTVMREFVASLAMLIRPDLQMVSEEGRVSREYLGEVFVQMVYRPEGTWKFPSRAAKTVLVLRPLYDQLDQLGLVQRMRDFMGDLSDLRNGFDHAWTKQNADFTAIVEKGEHIHSELEAVYAAISQSGLLRDHGPDTDDQQGNRT